MGMIFRAPRLSESIASIAPSITHGKLGAPVDILQNWFFYAWFFARKDIFVVWFALPARGFCVDRRDSSRNEREYFRPTVLCFRVLQACFMSCCSSSFSLEDILRIVSTLPDRGFCSWSNGIHRTKSKNHFCFRILDAISLEDILRIAFASPIWSFAPVQDVFLEKGFPLTKRRSSVTSENCPCHPDPDSCGVS